MKRFLLMISLLMVIGSIFADVATYDFSATDAVTGLNEAAPGIALDSNIGFGSFKNLAGTNPAIYSGALRLYQNETMGGSIKIYASNGVTITSVIVNASDRTGPAAFTVDGGNSTDISIDSGAYIMDGLSGTSVIEFYQKDASSSNRIYVNNFEVTYTVSGGNQAPSISSIEISPENPTENDAVTISANVSDDNAVTSVSLAWGLANDALTNNIDMNVTTAPAYVAASTIPAQAQGTTVYYQITATDDEDAVSTSSVMNYEIPLPTPVVTIAEIQGTEDASPMVGETVQTSGIVTFKDGNKWAIQSATGAYNGIWLYGATDAVIGDEVTVVGEVAEYYGLTQLTGDLVVSINSNENALPAPVVLTTLAVNDEQYEGVFVRVEDAECTDPDLGNGEWELNDSTGACVVDDEAYAYTATLGTHYNVQGVLNYSYSAYKIEPKDANDVEEILGENNPPVIANVTMTPEVVTATDAVQFTAEITDPENNIVTATLYWGTHADTLNTEINMTLGTAPVYAADSQIPAQVADTTVFFKIVATDATDLVGETSVQEYTIIENINTVTIAEIQGTTDESPLLGQTVQTSGIVTFKSNDEWAIQSETGAYNGIWVNGETDAVIGDDVTIIGTVEENYGLTRLNDVTVTINSSDNTLPDPVTILTGQVNEEQYEGVFVRVENAVCTNADLGYGEWEIDDMIDSSAPCAVDDMAYDAEAVLNNMYNVQGVVVYSFGAFKIEPKDANDVEQLADTTAPTITDLNILSETEIEVVFSEAVEQTSAETVANYAINSRLNITSAVLNTEDASKVNLTTETISGGNYTLTVTNVADLNANAITSEEYNFSYEAQIADGILVINEIMYNPSAEQGNDDEFEFAELVNTSDAAINLNGYHFGGFDFTFGDVTIEAGEYIIITVLASSFEGNGYDVYEITSGGLTNGGETITLYDAFDRIVDEVTYDDAAPWPTTPDGSGASLELISTDLDNSLAENWQGSYAINGTPGAMNSEPVTEASITFQLDMNSLTPSTDGVHVMGSFNDWNPAEISMIDENDDLIYSAIITLTPGETVQYKFVNGNTEADAEDVARILVVPGEDLVLPVVEFNDNFVETGELFISEYIEGTSNNKAIEIFNAMDIEMDLAGYRVVYHKHSGGDYEQVIHIFEQGTLVAGGDVFTMVADQAEDTLLEEADLALSYPSVVHFNGDDAIALEKMNADSEWEVVDIIGLPDVTPETAYAAAGVEDATKEHTMIRKSTVTAGNPDWNASAGTNADDSEWIVYPQNTFDYFGSHTMGADTAAPTIDNVAVYSETEIDVHFNEPVSATTAEIVSNYAINARVTIETAELDETSSSLVHLTVSGLTPANYTLTITNVEDVYGNAIVSETFDFVVEDLEPLPLVEISEIMYNPSTALGDDSEYEYLELYNYGADTADLSGFTFTAGVDFTFPENTTIDAGEYIVLAVNSVSYEGNGYDVYQFSGALGNSGEEITIQDTHNRVLDTVTYENGGDWPSTPNGSGASLELITSGSDNALAENWQGSYVENGTPGAANSTQPSATEYTIQEIQSEDHTGEFVQITGVVTTAFENNDSYLATIQQGTGEYSAIWVELDQEPTTIPVSVTIVGTVIENYDLTMITIDELTYNTDTVEMPEAEVLETGIAATEPWEAVLIQVQGMCNNENPDEENGDYGEWQVNDGTGDLRIDDLGYLFEPSLNATYKVTGVLNYNYGNFKLEPRDAADVELITAGEEVNLVNALIGNYPNPFNPTTTIQYSVKKEGPVQIEVYNVKGQKVKTLVNDTKTAGTHSIQWNGKNKNNQSVGSGVYFYRIKANRYTSTKKMILMK